MPVHERNFTRKLTPNPLDLIEYGDFSCRRCQELQKVLTTVLPLFEGQIQYTFRHFPNPNHPQAFFLALAAEAARRQDQYWAMHQALFAHGAPLSLDSVVTLALKVGLNLDLFLTDMHDESLRYRVWADMEQGRSAGVVSTPTLFMGTNRLPGKLTQARLTPLIRRYMYRSGTPVLSTVDPASGLVHWSIAGYC